jgi:hypothetical protein
MITIPIIGIVITAAQLGSWIVGSVVTGVTSWLVHKVLKVRKQAAAKAAALEARLDAAGA